MTPSHHPGPALLAAYGAGALAEAQALVIAAHAVSCAPCRAAVALAEQVGGSAMAAAEPVAMQAEALQRTLARLHEPAPRAVESARGPLERYLPGGIAAAPWRWRGPGIQVARLAVGAPGEPRTHLMRVAGGRRVPRHGHRGVELTLVLEGAYTDSLGRFAVGDVAELDESVDHAPMAEPGVPCVCLVVSEGRPVVRSPLARLVQAFGDV